MALKLSALLKPRLIVFDLDRTLWPFGIDEFVYKPPYKRDAASGKIFDSERKPMSPYPEVTQAIELIAANEIEVGVASRTTYPDGAYSLINLFGWDNLIKYREIYPGSKTTHFNNLKNKTGIDLRDMVFFDDEQRNINDTRPLGLTAILVNPESGITLEVIRAGLEQFAKNYNMSRSEE